MVPSRPPSSVGSSQSVPPSLLRSNSGMLGAQGGHVPSETAFPSLVSPRSQFNNMNFLGNVPNISPLMNQSFPNIGSNTRLQGQAGSQHGGGVNSGAESDPLSGICNGMTFTTPSSIAHSHMFNAGSTVQGQGQHQYMPNQQQPQQLEPRNFQHGQQHPMTQFASHSAHQQQQQFQSIQGGLGAVGPVKLEQQVNINQHGQQQQPLQSLRNPLPLKTEAQHSDHSLFLHQQQQQQLLHMSRHSSQAAAAQMNLLHQQRFLQMQQQQQLLKANPQQQSQLQQQFQPPNLPLRSPSKLAYEPGTCARLLTVYMYQQQHRPEDNNIEFWRKFVTEYFAPHARMRWCVSMYGSGRQTTGACPQDVWHCEICNRKPGRGFEATAEVLPRLFKIKYESGTLEEFLYVDMPREYLNSSGQIVLDYAKAIQESVFEQLRVVHDGQLRIVFNSDLKICSWEFCAQRHEELIPRRLLIPQVSHLGSAAQKYQAATQNALSNVSVPELQSNCNMFVASARQLAKALEVPLVNDLGYAKRFIRCLQISEVVNSMKDLIDCSRETGTGPMESLAKFSRRTTASTGFQDPAQQPEEQLQQQQQTFTQNAKSDQSSLPATAVHSARGNGINSINSSFNATSTSASTIAALLHQNSMNNRQKNCMNNASSPYGGSGPQIPSPRSSCIIPQAQSNPSPFQSPTPPSSNIPLHGTFTVANHTSSTNSPTNMSTQQPALSGEGDPSDSQSSVQKLIHEMMLSGEMNGAGGMVSANSSGNNLKNVNGVLSTGNSTSLNSGNSLVGNGTTNGQPSIVGTSFGTIGGPGQSAVGNGIRSTIANNTLMNGRAGMTSITRDPSLNYQQHELGNQLHNGHGSVNGFNNLQYD